MGKWIKSRDFEFLIWVLFMLMVVLFAAFLVSLGGCSQAPLQSALTSGTVYQYDLSVKVNNQQFVGVGVVPTAQSYELKIESQDSVDLVTVTTCHRDFSAQAVISQGWFKQKKGYSYTFVPALGLEDRGSCLLRVGMYSKDVGGQTGWAILDFDNGDTSLPAQNICNGSSSTTKGTSICQSKAGLIQILRFDVPVEVATDKLESKCIGQMSMDSGSWTYQIGSGECVIEFREIGGTHRKHRHTTVGYSQTYIRTGQ